METLGIQSSAKGTTQTFNSQERLEARQKGEISSRDQVELRTSRETFEDTDSATLRWDNTMMGATLSMIRSGSGVGVHGNLDPARVVSLLGEAGLMAPA